MSQHKAANDNMDPSMADMALAHKGCHMQRSPASTVRAAHEAGQWAMAPENAMVWTELNGNS